MWFKKNTLEYHTFVRESYVFLLKKLAIDLNAILIKLN